MWTRAERTPHNARWRRRCGCPRSAVWGHSRETVKRLVTTHSIALQEGWKQYAGVAMTLAIHRGTDQPPDQVVEVARVQLP